MLVVACATPPEVVLGTGEVAFEPIADGDVIQVVFGPQGGYHLVGSLVARGVEAGNRGDLGDPSNPRVRFEVEHEGENLAPIADFTQGLDESTYDGYTHEMINRLAILTIDDDAELDGEMVTFSVQIDDANGVSVRSEFELEVRPHPANDAGR
jgi:hypothetical protein